MTLVDSLSFVGLIVGLVLIVLQIKGKWPGWIAYPLILLLGNAVRDICLSPLVINYFGLGHQSVSDFVARATEQELPAAMGLVLLGYVAFGGGLIFVRLLGNKSKKIDVAVPSGESPDSLTEFWDRAWKASLVIASFGFLCNMFMLFMILRNNSLFSIASSRAIVTDETIVGERFYLWARMFAPSMQIGCWGMWAFTKKPYRGVQITVLASVIYALVQVIFGSRLSTITFLLGTTFIIHYSVRRLHYRDLISMGLVTVGLLAVITVMRFLGNTSQDLSELVFGQILVSPALDGAALALRLVPNSLPYLGPEATYTGLSYLFPTLNIVQPRSIWTILVDYLFSGTNPTSGIGGEHYVFAAEQYMQLGYSGVVVLSFTFGCVFGLLYEWQRQRKGNLFLLIFIIGVSMVFFRSFGGKMAASIGGMGMGVLIPVSLLTAFSFESLKASIPIWISIYFIVLFLFLRYLTGFEAFDYFSSLATFTLYVYSIRLIDKAGQYQNNLQESITGENQPLVYQ